MTRKDPHTYVLSTGREIEAHLGIIGIGEPNENNVFGLYEGYDGELLGYSASGEAHDFLPRDWTPAERRELAEFMIEQWQQFKAAQGS